MIKKKIRKKNLTYNFSPKQKSLCMKYVSFLLHLGPEDNTLGKIIVLIESF